MSQADPGEAPGERTAGRRVEGLGSGGPAWSDDRQQRSGTGNGVGAKRPVCLACSEAQVSSGARWGRRHLQPCQRGPPSPRGQVGDDQTKVRRARTPTRPSRCSAHIGQQVTSLLHPRGPAPPPRPDAHTPGHRVPGPSGEGNRVIKSGSGGPSQSPAPFPGAGAPAEGPAELLGLRNLSSSEASGEAWPPGKHTCGSRCFSLNPQFGGCRQRQHGGGSPPGAAEGAGGRGRGRLPGRAGLPGARPARTSSRGSVCCACPVRAAEPSGAAPPESRHSARGRAGCRLLGSRRGGLGSERVLGAGVRERGRSRLAFLRHTENVLCEGQGGAPGAQDPAREPQWGPALSLPLGGVGAHTAAAQSSRYPCD